MNANSLLVKLINGQTSCGYLSWRVHRRHHSFGCWCNLVSSQLRLGRSDTLRYNPMLHHTQQPINRPADNDVFTQ